MIERIISLLFGLALLATATPAVARTTPSNVDPVLPPLAPWSGSSRSLMVAPDDPWATPFEHSDGLDTPSYHDTVAWLERLVAASPRCTMTSIGRSHDGREIPMVIVSANGAASPGEIHRGGRPVVLVHGGIHAGEIDGKDAGMMLLRDLTVAGSRAELLERVSLLFVPILNVDGHERVSARNRINQRGPRRMGWRTNARNQNLNRDFAKLDTPEVRALVQAIERWEPDLYVDVHVTDGADWQYDVTWGYNGPHAHSPNAARWLAERLDPAATEALRAHGHIPGRLFFPADARDLTRGIVEWTATPRYSNGYGDARHLPSVLVETHSLKPFDRRVLGTYVFLESVLDVVGRHGESLQRAVADDLALRPDAVPVAWRVPADETRETRDLLAIEQRLVPSDVSGGLRVEWTGDPVALGVPWREQVDPAAAVEAPLAYWIPPAWHEVVERLALHGIRMERTDAPTTLDVEMYRLVAPRLDTEPLEGRVRVDAGAAIERRRETFPPGSVRVPFDQPLGVLAVLLLEPASPDSFFQWGFFHEILQRTEYAEAYVMEPTASRMLDADPALAEEFRKKLFDDPAFAGDADARLDWFFRRTEYHDSRWMLYPIAREVRRPTGTDSPAR